MAGTTPPEDTQPSQNNQDNESQSTDVINNEIGVQGKSRRRCVLVMVSVITATVLLGTAFTVPIMLTRGNPAGSKYTEPSHKWSEWSEWTPCNVTCGQGTRIRMRNCTTLTQQHDGNKCIGLAEEIKNCSLAKNCTETEPFHKWLEWSEWTSCNVTCGQGTKTRMRNCTTLNQQHDGNKCSGLTEEIKNCIFAKNCTDTESSNKWLEWSEWTPCNVTCGQGTKTRMRNCTTLTQQHDENKCSGFAEEITNCSVAKNCTGDCSQVYQSGQRRNGVYTVEPDGRGAFQVYCDMITDGGGWTVFQRRQDGSVSFYRNWNQYKTGFGNLTGEFWLGNDYIHRLTARTASTLRVELEDWGGVRVYAKYGSFSVGDEGSKFRLNVSSYSGSAGDALTYHNNMTFTTKDRDNDPDGGRNCAVQYTGAWWYKTCHQSNLNGQYLGNQMDYRGAAWNLFRQGVSLKFTEMKVRPQSF